MVLGSNKKCIEEEGRERRRGEGRKRKREKEGGKEEGSLSSPLLNIFFSLSDTY